MPFNGTGVFEPLPPPDYPAVAGEVIRASRFNSVINDVLMGLSNAITRNGESPALADLPMGGFKLTNVAAAVADDEYITLGQLGTAGVTTGAALLAMIFNVAFPEGTIGKALTDRTWCITDEPWGAVGDDATDNYAAILAAQTALSAAGGGTLLIPRGTFRILTAIPRVSNVDYAGDGWASILKPVGCGAFTYAFLTGFGMSCTRNMTILASGGSAQIAFYQAGTNNSTDELYGLLFEGLAILGFHICFKFRTARNATVLNCWMENCNGGIHLVGKCLVWDIIGCRIVYAAGSGTGDKFAIYTDFYAYSGTADSVRPEAVRVHQTTTFGFEYGLKLSGIIFGTVTCSDVQALIVGVLLGTAQSVDISSNYIQIAGAAATSCIWYVPQASVIDSRISIEKNNLNAVGVTAGTTIGVQIGLLAAAGNSDGMSVRNNEFHDHTLYDIAAYASGDNSFVFNLCSSPLANASIVTSASPAGRVTYIDQNACALGIVYDAADLTNGRMDVRRNVVNKSTTPTINYGNTDIWLDKAYDSADFTANSGLWAVDSGDVDTFAFRFAGNVMTVAFAFKTTTVIGGPPTRLQLKVPLAKVAARLMSNALAFINDAGTLTTGYVEIDVAGTSLLITRSDGAAFTASTNNTSVRGQITFQTV